MKRTRGLVGWLGVGLAILGLALADAPVQAASRCPFLMSCQLNVQMQMNNQPQQQRFNQPQFNNPMTQNRGNFPNHGGGGSGGGMNGPRFDSFGGPRITTSTARITTSMTRTTNSFDVRRTSVMVRTPFAFESTIRTPARVTTTMFREPGFGIGGGHRFDSFGGARITMSTTRTHWGLEWNTHVFHVPSLRIHTLTRTSIMTSTVSTERRIATPATRITFPGLGTHRPEFPQLATQRQPAQTPLKPVVQTGTNPQKPATPKITASLTVNMTCGKCHGCTHGGGPAKSTTTNPGTLTGRTTTVNLPKLPVPVQTAVHNPGKPATTGTLTGRTTTQPGTLTSRTGTVPTTVPGKTVVPWDPWSQKGLVTTQPGLQGFVIQQPRPLPLTIFNSPGFAMADPILGPGFVRWVGGVYGKGGLGGPVFSMGVNPPPPTGQVFIPTVGLTDRSTIPSVTPSTSQSPTPTVPQVSVDDLGLAVVPPPELPPLVDENPTAPRVLEILAREKPPALHQLKLRKVEVLPEALVEAPPLPSERVIVKFILEDSVAPVVVVNAQPMIDKLQQAPALPPLPR
jgi:hypothetical protein